MREYKEVIHQVLEFVNNDDRIRVIICWFQT